MAGIRGGKGVGGASKAGDGMAISRRGLVASAAGVAAALGLGSVGLGSRNQIRDALAAEAPEEGMRSGGRGGAGGMSGGMGGGMVDKGSDAELQDMIANVAPKFSQLDYDDAASGLSITYNLFLPEGYDADSATKYPLIVFIGDSTTVGNDPTVSLTQGWGGLIWASDAWQADHPCIVAVPSYTVTVIDDNNGSTISEYVELTAHFIEYMEATYAVDTARVYGTGQSMGCMTSMYLSATHPDLYTACMFVDGQWDLATITPLEQRTFVYFAAEGDQKAYSGVQELSGQFDADGVAYSQAQWDATWTEDQIAEAAQELFAAGTKANYITWVKGTVLPEGTAEGTSEHMFSFDYAYKAAPVREWLFEQTKDDAAAEGATVAADSAVDTAEASK